jgi:hypothetical protein
MDSKEFFRMLKSLLLHLTNKEIRKLHKKIDADKVMCPAPYAGRR